MDREIHHSVCSRNKSMNATSYFLYLCGGGNASILGGLWLLLMEAFPPRLASSNVFF